MTSDTEISRRVSRRAACMAVVLTYLGLFTWSGCVTKPDLRAAAKVKTVAIIGFSIVQPKGGPQLRLDHTFKSAAKFYRQVAGDLAAARGWQVLPLERVSGQSMYSLLAAKFSNHLLSSDIRPTGILSQEEQVNLSPKYRDQLRRALGVDGLVSIGFALSRRKPEGAKADNTATVTAKVSFDLYAGKGAKSIWQVSSLPSKPFATPDIPQDLGIAPGDETVMAQAVATSVKTMLELRQQEEALAKKK
ncbi:MAG: hypothetical protein FJ146_07540 [Deltaproteobacteria bacterium]|nr:hypothetical protein [Deltaproteobacteria bacterium]